MLLRIYYTCIAFQWRYGRGTLGQFLEVELLVCRICVFSILLDFVKFLNLYWGCLLPHIFLNIYIIRFLISCQSFLYEIVFHIIFLSWWERESFHIFSDHSFENYLFLSFSHLKKMGSLFHIDDSSKFILEILDFTNCTLSVSSLSM